VSSPSRILPTLGLGLNFALSHFQEGKSAYCSQQCQRTDRFTFEDCYNDDSASSSDLDNDNDEYYAEQKRHSAHPHSSSSSSSHHHHHHHRPRYDDIKRAFEAQQWPGHDRNNILAWANNIPLGCSGSVRPESLAYGSPKLRAPTFPLSRQRPVPPALCMSTTQTQSQSQSQSQATRVVATPLAASTNQQRRRAPSSARDGSASSLVSALTDSIATPLSEEVSNAAVAVAAPAPAIPSAARSKAGVFDGLTSRFGWGHTEKEHQHQHHQIPRRFEDRGFTVLSTAHLIESLADSDEPALFPPAKKSMTAMEPKTMATTGSGRESRGVSIVAKDAMYAKKERAPVSLKVERMYGEDHPAYRTRGRKAAAASGRA
jgi:hypothetical protein